jgi:hypothetical protein
LIKAPTLTVELPAAGEPAAERVEEHSFDGETLQLGVKRR